MHARVISVRNPAGLHPKFAYRLEHVDRVLVPTLKRLAFDSVEVFPAITNREYENDGKRIRYKGWDLQIGEGCPGDFLSHLELWAECVRLKEPMLILEDDAELPDDNFNNVMRCIQQYERDSIGGVILYLQSQSPSAERQLKVYSLENLKAYVVPNYPLCRLVNAADLSGTAAYCIDPRAAEVLIAYAKGFGATAVDNLIHCAYRDGVIGVVVPQDYQQGFMLNKLHYGPYVNTLTGEK